MIFTNVSIVVKDGKSKQDNNIYVYRGDRNIEIRFTIESPFKYTDMTNLIEDSDAYFAQLVIKKPNTEDEFIYSPIEPTEYGVAKLMITAEMIDETTEVGEYDYQIKLYDESINSRVTIPPIIGGIKILEPISLAEENASVNRAQVGYSLIRQSGERLETFDEEGKYNKTDWKDGDLITDDRLNKIEDALYNINEENNGVFERIQEIENETLEKIQEVENGTLEKIQEIENETLEKIQEVENGTLEQIQKIEDETFGKIQEIEDETSEKIQKIEDETLEKIQEIENKAVFETDELTINSLGGISAGTDLNGLSVKEVLNKLLYPYVKPTVSVTTTPNGGIYEHGDYQTITNVKIVITKKSEKITLLRILDGSEVIYSKQDSIENGGTFNISCNISIKDSKRLTVEVTDNAGSVVTTSTNVFNYIYPYYYGVANENTLLNGEFIKTLTKKVEVKGEKTLSYITNNQRMVFAYPSSYGKLSKILDVNSFDVTGTFTMTTVNLIALNGTTQSYYVYSNNSSTVENFIMKFSY